MSNCSNHKKEVAGITDAKILARMIVDTHYEWQSELWKEISLCYDDDGRKDFVGGREFLASRLFGAKTNSYGLHINIGDAWQISKPFMEPKK